MLILLWLLPAALVTAAAIAWAARAERDDPGGFRSKAAEARAARRFAEAINRPHIVNSQRPASSRDRSSGVAIRRD